MAPLASPAPRARALPGAEVARTTLSGQVVLNLACEIVRGQRRPGEPLPSEQELATRFDVSKPTVREAVRVLVGLGLVHAQQGKRTVVQRETEWNVLDPLLQEAFALEGRADELAVQLYEMRIILETASAARAATRATAEQIAEMRQLIEELRTIAAGPERDLDAFLSTDKAFHDVVAQASGNEVLRQVIRQVNGDLATAWSTTSITADELDALVDMHAAITDAIGDRDAERASERMRGHLERAASRTGRKR